MPIASPPRLGGISTTWSYDAFGNRLQQVASSGTTSYTYDSDNRLLTAGNLSFSYDADGNLITKITPNGNIALTFNAANRLASITGPGFSTSYTYDGDGDRVVQTNSAGTTPM